jgi:hypothetical protein
VRRANDPLPDEEPPAPTPEHIRQAPLFVVVRRQLGHAGKDYRRRALDETAARARKDTRRYWYFGSCFWQRTLGVDISEIDLPESMRELEDGFRGRVYATIRETVERRQAEPKDEDEWRPEEEADSD